VNFVDNEYFETIAGGGESNVVHNDVTYVTYTCVRRSIYLEYIDRVTSRDLEAGRAFQAWPAGYAGMTIEALGDDSCSGSLACSTRARKDIGMVNPVLIESMAQSARDMLLPDEIGERLRSVFSRNDLIAHVQLLMSAPLCRFLMKMREAQQCGS